MNSTAIALPQSQAPSTFERWYVLITMCLIYALNIADRYVVSTVLEPIRLELRLNDAGVAFLTGVPLALFYVTFGLPISWLADRFNRRNIVATALVLWSTFTVICGRSQTYLQLLLARIGVGVGEAGGLPPSSSIVSDCFPANRRPMAFTVLALANRPAADWMLSGVTSRPRLSAPPASCGANGQRFTCSWAARCARSGVGASFGGRPPF